MRPQVNHRRAKRTQTGKSPRHIPDTADLQKVRRPNSIQVLTTEISTHLFKFLEGYKIPTRSCTGTTGSKMPSPELQLIPLDVRVRNLADRESCKYLGIHAGTEFIFPVIEHYYKRGELGNPLLNEFHVYALNLATPEQLRGINRIAAKVNMLLRSFFERRGLLLESVTLEFGLSDGRLILTGEFSPRTCAVLEAGHGLNGKRRPGRALWKTPGLQAYVEMRNRIHHTVA